MYLVENAHLTYKNLSSSARTTSHPSASSQKLSCRSILCFSQDQTWKHGKVKWNWATDGKKLFRATATLWLQKTTSHLTFTSAENKPFATSSKWGFQWTKMWIHCQGGDILHMIGRCRLIKTSVQVTDSFLKPLHGFPSPVFCGAEHDIYLPYLFISTGLSATFRVRPLSVKSKPAECNQYDGLIFRWWVKTQLGIFPYLHIFFFLKTRH